MSILTSLSHLTSSSYYEYYLTNTKIIMKNPYLNRIAIKDINHFYGRHKEISRIFSRIGASRPQSVSIVGERRIGKSSLLSFIYAAETRAQQLDGDSYLFVFMDLQQKRYAQIEGFFTDLLTLIYEASGESLSVTNADFDSVRKAFADLHKRKKKLIILFDEFDAITANKVFSFDFFSFLRSAANNYDVAYITSSARELQILCHTDQIADSPFFNIFTNIYLRAFTPEEALLLIRQPSAEMGIPLDAFARPIIELGGYFPFFLQIACSSYFDHIQEQGSVIDIAHIEQSFQDEAGVHFRYIWEHFGEAEREVINAFIAHTPRSKSHEHVFEELRRAGYFIEEGGQIRLFSRLFAPTITRLSNLPSNSITATSPVLPPVVTTPVTVPQVTDTRRDAPPHRNLDYDSEAPSARRFSSGEFVPPTDPAISTAALSRHVRYSQKVSQRDSLEYIKQQGQIGRFEIIETIGKGGMGEVLLARDRDLMRKVAIKLLRSRYASDDQIRRRFLREAQTASMLNHPNIATIYEIGQIENIPYIVMEYIKGETLSEHLRRQPFTIAEVASIGEQVALALAEAHTAGIIHRDIKSSNILISEKGQVKVLDFGLAKPGIFASLTEQKKSSDPRFFNTGANSITEPGILMGTVTYMSPEQTSGQDKVDHRADIFSLGIVLYEITTGVLPFDGATYFQIMEAITQAEPISISHFRPDAPPKLINLIMKALAKAPTDRFQSAQAMAYALHEVS